jgi:hypothetical protein
LKPYKPNKYIHIYILKIIGACLEEKVEIGGDRGGRERLLEDELEVFDGAMSGN